MDKREFVESMRELGALEVHVGEVKVVFPLQSLSGGNNYKAMGLPSVLEEVHEWPEDPATHFRTRAEAEPEPLPQPVPDEERQMDMWYNRRPIPAKGM